MGRGKKGEDSNGGGRRDSLEEKPFARLEKEGRGRLRGRRGGGFIHIYKMEKEGRPLMCRTREGSRKRRELPVKEKEGRLVVYFFGEEKGRKGGIYLSKKRRREREKGTLQGEAGSLEKKKKGETPFFSSGERKLSWGGGK